MEIVISKLWYNPRLVLKIIKNFRKLNPFIIFSNPKIYVVRQGRKTPSFVLIKSWKNFNEIKSLYTEPQWRGNGLATKLLGEVINDHERLYLRCSLKLEKFYTDLKFVRVKTSFFPFRKFLYARLGILLTQEELIEMKFQRNFNFMFNSTITNFKNKRLLIV